MSEFNASGSILITKSTSWELATASTVLCEGKGLGGSGPCRSSVFFWSSFEMYLTSARAEGKYLQKKSYRSYRCRGSSMF